MLRSEADDALRYVPGQVIVVTRPSFAGGTSAPGMLSALGYRAMSSGSADTNLALVATQPGQTVEAAVAELASRGDVVLVQPNYIYHGLIIPNDPSYADQYYLSLIGAPQAWDISRGNSISETIAILDSGSDTTLIDLGVRRASGDTGRLVLAPGCDIVDHGDSDPSDAVGGSGHGAAVAGIVGAITNNGIQVSGIDWFSNILSIRVLDTAAEGTSFTIDSGIRAAIRHKAGVINMSIGFDGAGEIDALIEARLIEAENAGIIVVAAAGNSGGSPVIYPASSTHAIAVGASTSADERASFSSFGAAAGLTGIDVVAPGSGIFTLGLNSTTLTISGTSFSAPIVAAAAALVQSLRPGLTPAKFLEFLRSTAKDIGDAGYDEKTGAGRIDLLKLLTVSTSKTLFGDSLPFADTITGPLTGLGHQGQASFPESTAASYAGFFQKHHVDTGAIQFYWKPDSDPTSETRFIVTQKGNSAHSSGNIDLIFRSDKKLEYRLQDSGALVSASSLNPGQWYHIALSYGDSGMILYVNGDSEASKGVKGGPPRADTIFFGAPVGFSNALSAIGRFTSIAFANTQLVSFPSALFVKVERPAVSSNEVGTAMVCWKAYQTETNGIKLDVYADTDQTGFNGTLLASGLTNDQNENVSLASLEIGTSYFLYVIANDDSSALTTAPEKAFAYAAAAIVPGTPAVVTVGGSAGSPRGGCLIGNIPGDHSYLEGLRATRDFAMKSFIGRFLCGIYYSVLGR